MMLECDHHLKKRGISLFHVRNVNTDNLSTKRKVSKTTKNSETSRENKVFVDVQNHYKSAVLSLF